jgi:predicted regulator of Ras-like GTPase activity (Roadblock/LC7/MglB family)
VSIANQASGRLDWLLGNFQQSTPGVVHALVVSADGLRVASSGQVDDRVADQFSAATAGLVSLANGAANLVRLGAVTQTIVELANGHLFVTQISSGAMLAVVADRACDMGMVGSDRPRRRDVGSVVNSGQNSWRDGDRIVPAYALTQGRTRSTGRELGLESLVTATEYGRRNEAGLQMESRAIVLMTTRPISVAEVGAALRVPIGVARVLVSDLAEAGYLTVSMPISTDENGRPNRQILERLLDGLRSR